MSAWLLGAGEILSRNMPNDILQTRYNWLMNAGKFFFLVTIILFLPVTHVHAQLLTSGGSGIITISITPDNPQPGSIVRLSAVSSMIDLENSDITWYANQKVIAEGLGQTGASVALGQLGSEVNVVVIAQSISGATASGEVFISPSEVDILWESDSYTPPFYRGRALPSAGTKIRLNAIAHLMRADGSPIPENQILYTWRRNGTVIQTSSGKGRSFSVLPSPTLFGRDTFSVTAVSADGTRSGKSEITVASVEPVLVLYENHPLFGLLYNNAFGQASSVKDPEVTFAAVPYFAQANSPDDPQFVYGWNVNGQQIQADYSRPSEITINADNSTGKADISLSLTRVNNWYMKVSGAWKFSLPAGGSTAADPFGAVKQ
jgi:hypothetical protein